MEDIYKYEEFSKDVLKLKDQEVVLFTNHGIYKITFGEFDRFHEYMEVSRGEEGLTNKYLFAITAYRAIAEVEKGHIWRNLTQEEF